jgi:hypothetical protein
MSTKKPSLLNGPIHWVLDWDGTITAKDTLDALVNIAASSKPDFPTHDQWKAVVDAYISDYTSTVQELLSHGTLPTSISEEKKLLKKLKVVEQRSLDRVFESRIFEGLTREALQEGAKKLIASGEVILRPGCAELLRTVAHVKSDALHILSVNWSRHFISSCLSTSNAPVDPVLIIANELDGVAEGNASTGQISPDGSTKVIASDDKVRYLEAMREKSQAKIVYVGDSWTDVECLLAADLGICIRDEPMGNSQKKLAEALERLDVACPHLLELTGGAEKYVVWAKDFDEIKEWADRRGVQDENKEQGQK